MHAVPRMALRNPCLEACGIAVQHKLCGEVDLIEDGVRMTVFAHVDVDVGVAADENVCTVAAACGEEIPCEEFRALSGTIWVM